jgi:hypothetical protein
MPGTAVYEVPPLKSEVVNLASTDYTFTISVDELYVGGAGTVIAQLSGDATARTYLGVAAGTVLRGAFIKITKTGTTATGLIGRSRSSEGPAGL